MPWGRLDDTLYEHPKLDALGPSRLACVGLFALSLSWSNRWLTDGFIPADRVRKLGGTPTLADKLVTAGLWERTGDDYRIHDYLDFNDSRAAVEARREAEREKKRNQRAAGHRNVGHDPDTGRFATRPTGTATGTHGGSPVGSPPLPDPSRPDPSDSPPPPAERGRRKQGTSPRQVGDNPRAEGENPRANGTSPRQVRETQKRGPSKLHEILTQAAAQGKPE